jgi:hypothetical protein
MTITMQVCIKYDKQYKEFIIDNPKHIPHVGDHISFNHLKDKGTDNGEVYEITMVDHEYNIENNSLNILVLTD